MTDSPDLDRPAEPDRGAATSTADARVSMGISVFATALAGIFILLGFAVFFGGWGSMADTTDDVWLQLLAVGQGALPYFIAGGVFWLLAEYRSVHGE